MGEKQIDGRKTVEKNETCDKTKKEKEKILKEK